jgi:hypothetical protein
MKSNTEPSWLTRTMAQFMMLLNPLNNWFFYRSNLRFEEMEIDVKAILQNDRELSLLRSFEKMVVFVN